MSPVTALDNVTLFTALPIAVTPSKVLAFASSMLVTIFGLVRVSVVPLLVALVIPPNVLLFTRYCT